jgi:cell division protein FtsB
VRRRSRVLPPEDEILPFVRPPKLFRRPVFHRPRKVSFTGRAAVLAVVLAALAIALAGPVRHLISQRAELASLRSQVADGKHQVKDLQAQEKLWADPSFVAAQARERLHYVKPGEVPYITLGPRPSASDGVGPGGVPADQGPWYAQLWSSIRGADGPAPSPQVSPHPSPPATP